MINWNHYLLVSGYRGINKTQQFDGNEQSRAEQSREN